MIDSTNKITKGKQKKSILLASVGNDMFRLIRNLISQEQQKEKIITLGISIKRVKNHLTSRPNYIFARSEFFDCVQKSGQSVADFIVARQKLSEHCKFTNLNVMFQKKRNHASIAEQYLLLIMWPSPHQLSCCVLESPFCYYSLKAN